MNKSVLTIISWLPAQRGGRRQLPASAEGYSTLARFESDVHHSQGAWSVILSEVVNLRDNHCIRARFSFLIADAPQEMLATGERFELMEGSRVVAKGVVIPDALPIPAEVSEFELALLG